MQLALAQAQRDRGAAREHRRGELGAARRGDVAPLDQQATAPHLDAIRRNAGVAAHLPHADVRDERGAVAHEHRALALQHRVPAGSYQRNAAAEVQRALLTVHAGGQADRRGAR